MPESWTVLYQNAFCSEADQLVESVQIATDAIHARLRAIGFTAESLRTGERRSLFLALADLRVLKVAFRSRNEQK